MVRRLVSLSMTSQSPGITVLVVMVMIVVVAFFLVVIVLVVVVVGGAVAVAVVSSVFGYLKIQARYFASCCAGGGPILINHALLAVNDPLFVVKLEVVWGS